VTVIVGSGKCFHWSSLGIVTEESTDGVDNHGLTIAPCAVSKHELVFSRNPGKAISHPPLKEGDQFLVAIEDEMESLEPQRALSARRNRRHLGQMIVAVVWSHNSGLQIHRATRRVEDPGV
jgi:hypothetical protein